MLPVGMACSHGTWGVKENSHKKRSPKGPGDAGAGICLEGHSKSPKGDFSAPLQVKTSYGHLPRCLWVMPGDVPSCRWARCCCISQSRYGTLTWFVHSWTLTYCSLRDLVTTWERCSMGKGQRWEGQLVQKDRTATELWLMRIWRQMCYSGGQYLIRPSSCPFTSTIFSSTISLSVLDEYLDENEAGKSHQRQSRGHAPRCSDMLDLH